MGHFAHRCGLSNLAIPGGTLVRVVPLVSDPWEDGVWHMRAPAIRATYDDYGGVTDVADADLPTLDLWRRGFDVDVVDSGDSKGVRPGMSAEQYLKALKDQAIQVRTDQDFWLKPPRESQQPEKRTLRVAPRDLVVPNPRVVERLIADGGYDMNLVRVDEPTPKLVRVRWEWSAGALPGGVSAYGHGTEVLGRVKRYLEDKTKLSASLTATPDGGDRREAVLLLVAGPTDYSSAGPRWGGLPEDVEHVLDVRWALVRDDVWCALAELPHREYCGGSGPSHTWYGLPELREAVREAWDLYVRHAEPWARLKREERESGQCYFGDFDGTAHEDVPNRVRAMFHGPAPSVLSIAQHLFMLMAAGTSPNDSLFDTLAETISVTAQMRWGRRAWQPTDGTGPQDAMWREQVRYERCILRVAERESRAQGARGELAEPLCAPTSVEEGLREESLKARREAAALKSRSTKTKRK